jgi:integrase
MNHQKSDMNTLKDALESVQRRVPDLRRRDMISAVTRICEMAGAAPATVPAEATVLRALIAEILPALHGVTEKTWANLLSQFRAALRHAGVIDPQVVGAALQDPAWAPLVRAVAGDRRLSSGLASFFNWCALQGIVPGEVDDAVVLRFLEWLETRTLCPKPRDVARRVPNCWNDAADKSAVWPRVTLSIISFRSPPKRVQSGDLPESFRADRDAYLAMRRNPDLFDERPNAPKRPLAPSTVHQQSEHIRLAASVLIESGIPREDIKSLADLIEPERFKQVLRHYMGADGAPNAFVIGVAKTLIAVAYHHVGADAEHLGLLKFYASKLSSIPFKLTPKNKALLRQFESEGLRAKLIFLPDTLVAKVSKAMETGRVDFVLAQVAIAIDFQLAIPLRPQNLSRLNWRRHFSESDGPKGRLLLHIPAAELKSRRDDFVAEVPEHVAQRLRWYRRHILPRLNADVNGDLFVTKLGQRKDQRTITKQIIKAIERYLGIHMTPHQFRHFCGHSYVEDNPVDLETPRALLGHASSKTTRIYVDSDGHRASRAFSDFAFRQREKLKLARKRPTERKPKKGSR